jgi:CubicO group peptidase (beta-lactamase class C family)
MNKVFCLLVIVSLFAGFGCDRSADKDSNSMALEEGTEYESLNQVDASPIPVTTTVITDSDDSKVDPETPVISGPTDEGGSPQPIIFSSTKDYASFSSTLDSAFQSAVDKEFSAISEKAGISVAVYTDGTVWTYATGEADTDVEMTIQTPLMVSSTSKTFLSALILTQIENGLYKLSDSLETVFSHHPDYPSFSPEKVNHNVTIEELLTMSSGMADFSKNMQGKSGSYKKPDWSPSDTINLIQSPPKNSGTFVYNDTNVVLLGIIAELYTGKPLSTLYRETFFNPLGITTIILPEEGIAWHKDLFSDQGNNFSVPRIAMPYTDVSTWGGSGFGNMIQTAPFGLGYYIGAVGRLRYACCGVISLPEHVALWSYELYRPNGSAISETTRTQLLNSFSETRIPPWAVPNESYGYLASKRTFDLGSSRIITAYGHPGGGGGYSSLMRYSPELDLSISILANSELSFKGSCGKEKPLNCMAKGIFTAYADAEGGK